jgi:hypothetical protein
MLTDWDNTDKVSAVWPTQSDLICSLNGTEIQYTGVREDESAKELQGSGRPFLRGLAQLNLIRPIRLGDHVLPRAAMHAIADARRLIPAA